MAAISSRTKRRSNSRRTTESVQDRKRTSGAVSEWATHGLEVGFSGSEVLTHAGDEKIQIHSVEDGRLVMEASNPFGLATAGRLHGRLLLKPGSTRGFDVKAQREFNVPFKIYKPQA